jgi:hypothetical protein
MNKKHSERVSMVVRNRNAAHKNKNLASLALMSPVQNIHLDTDIRDWVLLPLLLILLFVGLMRHYVTVLLNAKNQAGDKNQDVSNLRNQQVATYCRQLMGMGQFLPYQSVRERVERYSRSVLSEEIKHDAMAALSSPDMMQNMLKNNVSGMLPNVLMMSIATSFFGGFVVARFPFQLSPKFKGMLQQGVAIDNLDCAYATSMSLFFLCMFALNGVLKLLLGSDADISNQAAMAQMNPAAAMAQQQQPGVDHGKVFKQLQEEMQYSLDHHQCVLDHAPLWLSQGV